MFAHFNEVDDHLAANVAQLQLAGNGLGRFHVGLEGHVLEVALAGDLAGVDVNGHQGFGLVEDQASAGRHEHLAAVDLIELPAQVEAFPQGVAGIIVHAHKVLLVGEEHGHGVLDAGGNFGIVHPDFADIVGEVVAHGPFGQAGLLVDAGRSSDPRGVLADFIPGTLEVGEVVLQGGLGHAGAHCAHDDTKIIARINAVHELAQTAALFLVVHLAGNANLFLTRSEHQEASGQGNPRGQKCALGSVGFLDDLDQHFLAKTQHLLDGRILLAAHVLLRCGEVLGMDLVDLQKAVFLGAEIHEGSLQVDVNVDNDTAVDIALDLLLMEHVKVVFIQDAIVGNGHLDLLAGQNADVHAAFSMAEGQGCTVLPVEILFVMHRGHGAGGAAGHGHGHGSRILGECFGHGLLVASATTASPATALGQGTVLGRVVVLGALFVPAIFHGHGRNGFGLVAGEGLGFLHIAQPLGLFFHGRRLCLDKLPGKSLSARILIFAFAGLVLPGISGQGRIQSLCRLQGVLFRLHCCLRGSSRLRFLGRFIPASPGAPVAHRRLGRRLESRGNSVFGRSGRFGNSRDSRCFGDVASRGSGPGRFGHFGHVGHFLGLGLGCDNGRVFLIQGIVLLFCRKGGLSLGRSFPGGIVSAQDAFRQGGRHRIGRRGRLLCVLYILLTRHVLHVQDIAPESVFSCRKKGFLQRQAFRPFLFLQIHLCRLFFLLGHRLFAAARQPGLGRGFPGPSGRFLGCRPCLAFLALQGFCCVFLGRFGGCLFLQHSVGIGCVSLRKVCQGCLGRARAGGTGGFLARRPFHLAGTGAGLAGCFRFFVRGRFNGVRAALCSIRGGSQIQFIVSHTKILMLRERRA